MDQIQNLCKCMDIIREDHREIERLLEQFDNLTVTDEHKEIGIHVLGRIAEFFICHFQHEERAMYLVKYSLAGAHTEDHSAMFNMISNELAICEKYARDDWACISTSLKNMYRRHLFYHDMPLLEMLENM